MAVRGWRLRLFTTDDWPVVRYLPLSRGRIRIAGPASGVVNRVRGTVLLQVYRLLLPCTPSDDCVIVRIGHRSCACATSDFDDLLLHRLARQAMIDQKCCAVSSTSEYPFSGLDILGNLTFAMSSCKLVMEQNIHSQKFNSTQMPAPCGWLWTKVTVRGAEKTIVHLSKGMGTECTHLQKFLSISSLLRRLTKYVGE